MKSYNVYYYVTDNIEDNRWKSGWIYATNKLDAKRKAKKLILKNFPKAEIFDIVNADIDDISTIPLIDSVSNKEDIKLISNK